MAVTRPTFSESWYRVADLQPRLSTSAQIRRQHYRGRVWYVVQDASGNQFYRFSGPANRFIGLLDGRRTVGAVWKTCSGELGDEAPTQGEAIQLLGQLYSSNLLRGDFSDDAEVMFRRYRKRVAREVRGFLANLLFVRIPLLDPDRFLDRWVVVFGRMFSRFGLLLWLALIAVGLCSLAGHGSALVASSGQVLSVDNLLLLYLAFVLVKLLHEFGHGFACKQFGINHGTGGEVHTMGIMLLVFVPIPYVDASSAWALRSKWQRVTVAAAGMFVELAVAAAAAMVWVNTAEGTATHAVCYNIMFIASISTLLFNGNPLLRYDGYYILSDLLEIPNLAQRGREYVYYLVKRYAWGCECAPDACHTPGERNWLLTYAIASTAYRVTICFAILLFVAGKMFFVGALLAMAALVAWVLLPLARLLRYLVSDSQLARVRSRAVASTLVFFVAVTTTLGIIPVPDCAIVDGTVEPRRLAIVHASVDGFVEETLPSGQHVTQGTALVTTANPKLTAKRAELLALVHYLEVRRDVALREDDLVAAQMTSEQLAAMHKQINRVNEQTEQSVIRAPFDGTWVAPEIDRARGTHLHRGDDAGLVGTLGDLMIRATADQEIAAQVFAEVSERVEIRVAGRPDIQLTGTIEKVFPVGHERLPSAALGHALGGSIKVDPQDPSGTKTTEPFFEIRIRPENGAQLLPMQRVVVRLKTTAKPLAIQWWQSLARLLQRRFHI